MKLTAYLGNESIHELHNGELVNTVTLVLPKLTKKEYATLLERVHGLGQVTVEVCDEND